MWRHGSLLIIDSGDYMPSGEYSGDPVAASRSARRHRHAIVRAWRTGPGDIDDMWDVASNIRDRARLLLIAEEQHAHVPASDHPSWDAEADAVRSVIGKSYEILCPVDATAAKVTGWQAD